MIIVCFTSFSDLKLLLSKGCNEVVQVKYLSEMKFQRADVTISIITRSKSKKKRHLRPSNMGF